MHIFTGVSLKKKRVSPFIKLVILFLGAIKEKKKRLRKNRMSGAELAVLEKQGVVKRNKRKNSVEGESSIERFIFYLIGAGMVGRPI